MAPISIILLCSSRLALPAMRDLAFYQMLKAVVIPASNDEIAEQAAVMLAGSGIMIERVEPADHTRVVTALIEKLQINLALVISYPHKIPAALFSLPAKGFYNIHPGPLPAYRGADPVFYQILNREKQAGAALHALDEGFDTGPVFMQEMIPLLPTDTYGMVTGKLSLVAARLVTTLIKVLGFGVAVPLRQQNNSLSQYYKKPGQQDIIINWQQMDAEQIAALVRACNPWNKGAVTSMNGQVLRLLDALPLAQVAANPQILPGTIAGTGPDGITVANRDGGALQVKMIYTDEGFLLASAMVSMGLQAGQVFDTMHNVPEQ